MIGFKKTAKPAEARGYGDVNERRGLTKMKKNGAGGGSEDTQRRRSSSPGTKLVDKRDGPALTEKKIALIARLGENERTTTKLRVVESQIERLQSALE